MIKESNIDFEGTIAAAQASALTSIAAVNGEETVMEGLATEAVMIDEAPVEGSIEAAPEEEVAVVAAEETPPVEESPAVE